MKEKSETLINSFSPDGSNLGNIKLFCSFHRILGTHISIAYWICSQKSQFTISVGLLSLVELKFIKTKAKTTKLNQDHRASSTPFVSGKIHNERFSESWKLSVSSEDLCQISPKHFDCIFFCRTLREFLTRSLANCHVFSMETLRKLFCRTRDILSRLFVKPWFK